ncbi:MAG: hypothetical protein KY468_13600 [Armatimonadetes bacterium]|nr:hypothetical protein [Armatimonadota bacterium]
MSSSRSDPPPRDPRDDLPAAVPSDPKAGGGAASRVTQEQLVHGRAPEPPHPPSWQSARVITWRSILLGFLLLPPFDYWVLDMEVRTSSVEPTDLTLVAPVVVALFLLVGINGLFRRWLPRWAFSPAELLVVYSILMLGVGLSSMNAMPIVIYLMTYGRRWATPENAWEGRILPHFPDWLVIKDEKLVRDWYLGYGTLYTPETFLAWAKPAGFWLLFVSCLVLSAYCINAIFIRQWSRAERLTFPVLQLPMAMVEEGRGSIFRQRIFWLAFGLAGGINLLNGFSALYPGIPRIQTAFLGNLHEAFPNPPMNALGWTPINVYPFVIGLGFLMPLDLSFSYVFFYWVWKAERVIGRAYGVDVNFSALIGTGYPHYRHQMMGVWIAILVMTIYNARSHLAGVWRTATGQPGGVDDSMEPIRYRWALIGAATGLAGMLTFLLAAGMAFMLAFAYVSILLAMYVAIARIRCELGPPAQDLPASGPDVIATTAYTPQTLGSRNLATLTSLFFLNGEHYRSAPSGAHMETLKMAETHHGLSARHWLAMFFATIFGAIVGMWALVHAGYEFGGGPPGMRGAPHWYGWQAYTRMDNWLSNPTQATGPAAPIFGAISFTASIIMLRLRTLIFGFPFNPIAYAVTGYWTGDHFWFPVFIAYLCKLMILRYGGLKMYRSALPFFFGLILGEFTIGMGWQVVALILKTSVYTYWR